MTIEKWSGSRHWAVFDEAGKFVCLFVHKKGAIEVVGRFSLVTASTGSAE